MREQKCGYSQDVGKTIRENPFFRRIVMQKWTKKNKLCTFSAFLIALCYVCRDITLFSLYIFLLGACVIYILL